MQIDEIAKGSAVEIEVKYDGKNMTFKSEVILVTNNSVLITSITFNDQTIGFNDKYQINFLCKVDGKLYVWEKVSAKLVKYEGNVYHMIDLVGDGKHYNRRNSFRVYVGKDMPIYVNSSSGPIAISALIKDISETGVSFITKQEFDINRTIRIKLSDEGSSFNLSGLIVRKELLEHLGSYLYGCRFTENNVKLGKYITKKQSNALNKRSAPITSPNNKVRR